MRRCHKKPESINVGYWLLSLYGRLTLFIQCSMSLFRIFTDQDSRCQSLYAISFFSICLVFTINNGPYFSPPHSRKNIKMFLKSAFLNTILLLLVFSYYITIEKKMFFTRNSNTIITKWERGETSFTHLWASILYYPVGKISFLPTASQFSSFFFYHIFSISMSFLSSASLAIRIRT